MLVGENISIAMISQIACAHRYNSAQKGKNVHRRIMKTLYKLNTLRPNLPLWILNKKVEKLQDLFVHIYKWLIISKDWTSRYKRLSLYSLKVNSKYLKIL